MQSDPLHIFLESPAGQALLRGCASKLDWWMKNNGLAGRLFGCDGPEDIAGEIVLLVMERDGLRRELEGAAVNGNYPGLRSLIMEAFRRYALERRRSNQAESRHVMYRKIVRLLGQRDGFVVYGTKDGSWYAPRTGNISDPPALITLPAWHDYGDWPHPAWDRQGRLESNLEQAAAQFWKLGAGSSDPPGYAAVRDLLAWLEAKAVVDVRSRKTVSASELPGDGSVGMEEWASVPAFEPLERETLRRLARRIVAAWKPETVQAFHLVHGEGRKQADAAKIMGYASAAGVNYPLRQAILHLRETTSIQPELFGGEQSEAAQELFLECVLAECRTRQGNGQGFEK